MESKTNTNAYNNNSIKINGNNSYISPFGNINNNN
jgi:hypothetical protein